jgi:hypothetical protein
MRKEESIEKINQEQMENYNFVVDFSYPKIEDLEEKLSLEIKKFLKKDSQTHDAYSTEVRLLGKIRAILNEVKSSIEIQNIDLNRKVNDTESINRKALEKCQSEMARINKKISYHKQFIAEEK